MLYILSHELKYYFKNSHELLYIYGFYLLIMLIVPMGLQEQLNLLPELAPAIIWIAIMASIGLGAASLFQRDAESGVMELYQQIPMGLGQVVLGKWLAFYLATAMPIILFMPAIIMLFGLPVSHILHYAIGAATGTLAISILASLIAVITIGLERARAVSLLMLLPLAVPVMIFGSEYLRRTEALWQPQLLFMLAFSLFLLPILCLAGASCIRASN